MKHKKILVKANVIARSSRYYVDWASNAIQRLRDRFDNFNVVVDAIVTTHREVDENYTDSVGTPKTSWKNIGKHGREQNLLSIAFKKG